MIDEFSMEIDSQDGIFQLQTETILCLKKCNFVKKRNSATVFPVNLRNF